MTLSCFSTLYPFSVLFWSCYIISVILPFHSYLATSTTITRIAIKPITTATTKRKIISTKSIHSTKSHFNSNFGLRDLKVAIAGGLAGGIANAVLFPLDTFKTMRQTDKSIISLSSAYQRFHEKGFFKIYSGFFAAVIGSTSSSAIYFGTYEYSKRLINAYLQDVLTRPLIYSLAAISGNVMSSIIFVPKDVIKQQMQSLATQALQTPITATTAATITNTVNTITNSKNIPTIKWTTISLIKNILLTKGIKGFYPSYRATLLRNIPSAVLRFTIYEELKHFFMTSSSLPFNQKYTKYHNRSSSSAGGTFNTDTSASRAIGKSSSGKIIRSASSVVNPSTTSHSHSHTVPVSEHTAAAVLPRLLPTQQQWRSLLFMVAGGLASSLSSGLTTPLDVVKTRLATGMTAPGE